MGHGGRYHPQAVIQGRLFVQWFTPFFSRHSSDNLEGVSIKSLLRNSLEVVELMQGTSLLRLNHLCGMMAMDSVPLYVLIGSILGIVSGIVLLILHVPQLVTTIRSFINWTYRWAKWCRVMFREWRWWKRYRPTCEIVKIGNLIIIKSDDEYTMALKIDIKYQSRDIRFDTQMDISAILLDVYNTGKGRDSKPYRLSPDNWTLKIHPIEEDNDGGFPVMAYVWKLPRRESVVLKYTFRGRIRARPLVDISTSCQIIDIGRARVEEITGSRQLKVPDKFEAKVDKGYEE